MLRSSDISKRGSLQTQLQAMGKQDAEEKEPGEDFVSTANLRKSLYEPHFEEMVDAFICTVGISG
jgi:hypothetical protein